MEVMVVDDEPLVRELIAEELVAPLSVLPRH